MIWISLVPSGFPPPSPHLNRTKDVSLTISDAIAYKETRKVELANRRSQLSNLILE
ncbi:beta-ala-his dipeptidase [Moniliophthora roreri]|nr:beta-ala-his dipeptidase [Moniliophthora roreri]